VARAKQRGREEEHGGKEQQRQATPSFRIWDDCLLTLDCVCCVWKSTQIHLRYRDGSTLYRVKALLHN
jgi:hypothetical protein